MQLKMFFIFIFFTGSLWGQFNIGGYFENTSIMSGGRDSKFSFLNNSTLKVDMLYKAENWNLVSDLRLGLLYGYNDAVSAQPNGFLFFENKNGTNNFAISLDVARLYLKMNAPGGFVTLGRSYLSFGQAYLFNTLEWNKNFNLLDPLATKPGINMLAWDLGIGSYSKMKFFIGGDDNWDTPLAGTELIIGTTGFEFGTAYQYKGHNINVWGIFFKADLEVSLFGTYALHFNHLTSTNKPVTTFQEFSLGIDYSFSAGLTTILLQQIFYFNSIGAQDKVELAQILPGDYYFRGQSYSYTSMIVTVNEFVSTGLDILVSMSDGSGAVLPKGTFTLLDNLILDAVMGIFFGGDGTEFAPNQVYANIITPNVNFYVKLKASF